MHALKLLFQDQLFCSFQNLFNEIIIQVNKKTEHSVDIDVHKYTEVTEDLLVFK